MTDQTAVAVKNVSFSYGKVPVLEDINLQISKNDFLAVIGPNGGGKTTLLKIISGLLKPQKGEVKLFGLPPHKTRTKIGYVPQQNLFDRKFPLSVYDAALLGRLKFSKIKINSLDKEKTDSALKRVDMYNLKDKAVGELSGGQIKRVFIARALASEPEILILDEPTADIDASAEIRIFDFLKEINKRVTIIIVTHDIGMISNYIKKIACLNKRLYFHNTSHLTEDMIKQVYHCPVDIIAHGVPHRVFAEHKEEKN